MPGADPLEVALRHPQAPTRSADSPTTPWTRAADTDAVTVSAQQWTVDTEWVVSGHVRLRRHIVTERRTIEVEVRREVVEVHGDTVDFRNGRLLGTDVRGPRVEPPTVPEPFVAVLREEVPVVTLQVRPYERLVVTTSRVAGTATMHDTVQHEQVDLTLHPLHDTKEN